MAWFRESHSDPSMLAYMADMSQHEPVPAVPAPVLRRRRSLRRPEPPICTSDPADDADSPDLMARSAFFSLSSVIVFHFAFVLFCRFLSLCPHVRSEK